MKSFVRLWALYLAAAVMALAPISVSRAASPIETPRAPRAPRPAAQAVTVLKGDSAKNFRAQLLATNPRYAEAQRISAQRMRARGFASTAEVMVVILPRQSPLLQPASQAGGNFFLSPARWRPAQTYESGEGYMVVNSWDDGNNATWEGNLYFVDNVEGHETSVDNQEDVSGPEPLPVYWAEGEMWGGGGHGPYPISFSGAKKLLRFRTPGSGPLAAAPFSVAAMQNPCRCGMLRLAKCFVQNGWSRGWTYCAGAFAGSLYSCAFLGPITWTCVAGWGGGGCIASLIGSTLGVIRDHWNECTAADPEMCAL